MRHIHDQNRETGNPECDIDSNNLPNQSCGIFIDDLNHELCGFNYVLRFSQILKSTVATSETIR